jgi:hypothetical protein
VLHPEWNRTPEQKLEREFENKRTHLDRSWTWLIMGFTGVFPVQPGVFRIWLQREDLLNSDVTEEWRHGSSDAISYKYPFAMRLRIGTVEHHDDLLSHRDKTR